MNKFFMGTAVFALVATAASADSVRVYNWSDYIDDELLEKFEAETGLELIYDVFDSNEVLETKMLAGGSRTFVHFLIFIHAGRTSVNKKLPYL